MAVGDNTLAKIDAYVADLFAGWDIYSTLLATALFIFLIWPLLTWKDPDVHPILLARQASASPVRQPGESAVYRSLESPQGYPLRRGLGVKDPGAPRWSSGRNGDLRDIWRQAVRGAPKEDGTPSGDKGKLYTVLGREKTITHALEDVSQEINIIGQYITEANGKTVAICLSDSVELLSAIFAAAFYGFKPVLVPHNLSTEQLIAHLRQAQPAFLVAEAGSVELSPVVSACPVLSHVIWVVQHGSRHMDWNEVPEGIGGRVEVSVWHELVDEKKSSVGPDLPESEPDSSVGPLATFWSTEDGSGKLVEYTSENLVAAVGALISALPRNQRLGVSDVFLPVDSLSFSYPLTLTFAALFSNSSVMLNSVAGDDVDLTLAVSGIAPTVIAASSNTLARYRSKDIAPQTGLLTNIGRWSQAATLQAGNMPKTNALIATGISKPTAASKLDKVRLIFASYRSGVPKSQELSSEIIEDLRIFLGARVAYAFTAAPVAGAICQTNIYDYRKTSESRHHFGPPLSCLEVKVVGGDEQAAERWTPRGRIVVEGPSVIGGNANLGIEAAFSRENTLHLI